VNSEREARVPAWRKSTHSGNTGGSCVETAPLARAVGIRDSKDPAVGHIVVEPAAWSALLASVKAR